MDNNTELQNIIELTKEAHTFFMGINSRVTELQSKAKAQQSNRIVRPDNTSPYEDLATATDWFDANKSNLMLCTPPNTMVVLSNTITQYQGVINMLVENVSPTVGILDELLGHTETSCMMLKEHYLTWVACQEDNDKAPLHESLAHILGTDTDT